jgi:hypothetical protein
MIRASGPRVGWEDPESLQSLVSLHQELDDAILVAVAGQRATGITWESIGEATGTTRQAAIQKWGKSHRRRATPPRVIPMPPQVLGSEMNSCRVGS